MGIYNNQMQGKPFEIIFDDALLEGEKGWKRERGWLMAFIQETDALRRVEIYFDADQGSDETAFEIVKQEWSEEAGCYRETGAEYAAEGLFEGYIDEYRIAQTLLEFYLFFFQEEAEEGMPPIGSYWYMEDEYVGVVKVQVQRSEGWGGGISLVTVQPRMAGEIGIGPESDWKELLFAKREDLEAKLSGEFEAWKAKVEAYGKEELVGMLYAKWRDMYTTRREEEAVKAAIKKTLGVEL